jgi:hypothetical protein
MLNATKVAKKEGKEIMKKKGIMHQFGRNDLKRYFGEVLSSAREGKPFPVDLDRVWPLAYERKEHAVRDLRKMCVQSVDYAILPKIGENVVGRRPSDDYRISIPCLEWLIARKVRAVFEVYRRVFHQAMGTGVLRTSEGFEGYDYAELLRGLGMSVTSGSFWKRIGKYPTEFRKEGGAWVVSAVMAGMIRQQKRIRETYRELAEKREKYLEGQRRLAF